MRETLERFACLPTPSGFRGDEIRCKILKIWVEY